MSPLGSYLDNHNLFDAFQSHYLIYYCMKLFLLKVINLCALDLRNISLPTLYDLTAAFDNADLIYCLPSSCLWPMSYLGSNSM